MACNFWGKPPTNLPVAQKVVDSSKRNCVWSLPRWYWSNLPMVRRFFVDPMVSISFGSSLYKNHEPYERWAMNGTFVQEESGQALQYIEPKKIHIMRTSPGTWFFFFHWPNCRGFLAEEAEEALRNSSSALFYLEAKLDLEPRCSSLTTQLNIT